jgi:hypothetical protein
MALVYTVSLSQYLNANSSGVQQTWLQFKVTFVGGMIAAMLLFVQGDVTCSITDLGVLWQDFNK